ncbi:MAG: phage tail tube protein [Anaerovoracaceae bacterium]
MRGKDAINGAEGKCFVTIDGRRLLMANLLKVNVDSKIDKKTFATMGDRVKKHKSGAMEITAKATFLYNAPVFRQAIAHYKETGEELYFECLIENDDKSSGAGRQATILKDCNLDGIVIAKLDVDEVGLEEDVEFTADDFDYPEMFKEL